MSKITYRSAVLEDIDLILQFYNDNLPGEEPLGTALGLKPGDVDRRDKIVSLLPDGTSVLAFHNDVLVGVRMSSVHELDQNAEPVNQADPSLPNAKIIDLLNALDAVCLPKLPENVKKICKTFITNVRPDYMRQGIASNMMREVERRCQEKGCQAVYTQATNIKTQTMYQKYNWTKLGEILHVEYLNQNGQPVFNMKPEHATDRVTGMVKIF